METRYWIEWDGWFDTVGVCLPCDMIWVGNNEGKDNESRARGCACLLVKRKGGCSAYLTLTLSLTDISLFYLHLACPSMPVLM